MKSHRLVIATAAVLSFLIVVALRISTALNKPEPSDSNYVKLPAPSLVVDTPVASALPSESMDRPAASPRIRVSVGEPPSRSASEWRQLFFDTADYYDFVASAAQAALRGDGRAAYYVRQALARCRPVLQIYKRREGEPALHAKSEYENRINAQTSLSAAQRDEQLALFDRCARLAEKNAFAGLSLQEEGYSPEYWNKVALELKDPLALAEQLSRERMNFSHVPKEERRDAFEKIRRSAQEIFKTKDPQALFTLGAGSPAFGRPGEANSSGLGLALAACELGADCLFSHLGMQIAGPGFKSTDNPNLSFADAMRLMVGEERFGRAYREAQEVKEMLYREEWESVEQYFRIGE